MENPFEFHEEDTIIACVGDNGGTTDEDIRNGFKRTVELLTESLKTGSEVEDLCEWQMRGSCLCLCVWESAAARAHILGKIR